MTDRHSVAARWIAATPYFQALLRIVAAEKATALFVTHDLEEAIYLGDRVVALYPNPGRVAQIFDVALPRPRDQLTTRESPQFLSLRRQLFDFVREGEG